MFRWLGRILCFPTPLRLVTASADPKSLYDECEFIVHKKTITVDSL